MHGGPNASSGSLGARVYDLLEGDEPHFDDLAWYRARLDGVRGCVLELAAGTGRLTRALASIPPRLVALDLDLGMLGVLRDRTTRIDGIVRGDLLRLPFRSARGVSSETRRDHDGECGFGACFCAYNALGCLLDRADLRRAFDEMRRVTVAGGKCLFDVGEVRPEELPRGEKRFDGEHWVLPDGGYLTRQIRVRSVPEAERVDLDFVYQEVKNGGVAREEHTHTALNTWALEEYVRAAQDAGFEVAVVDERFASPGPPIRLWAFVELHAPGPRSVLL
jgi:SAM-dependent methyltransferase